MFKQLVSIVTVFVLGVSVIAASAEGFEITPGNFQFEMNVAGQAMKASVKIEKGAGSSLRVVFKQPSGPLLQGSITKENSFFAAGAIQNQLTILTSKNPTADLIEGEAKVGPVKSGTVGTFTLTRVKK